MASNGILKDALKHLWPALIFTALMLLYFYPVLKNETLVQTDVIQIKGTHHEVEIYKEQGERILWTNSSFGGMPVFLSSPWNIYYHLHRVISFLLPTPMLLTVLGFIGFYILMQTFNVSIWLSFAGAAGFVLSSFNFISMEAGHVNKVFDIMLMAPVLAGVIEVYRGKIWKGTTLLIVFLGLQIFYGHVQINYYLAFMILGIFILELINTFKEKKVKPFLVRSLLLLAIVLVIIGSNIVQLWSTMELAPSTTRGGSELTKAGEARTGLDYDYAYQWSNGISETFTLLIPYFKGGSSNEDLGTNSEIYKSLIGNGVGRQQAQRYAGSFPLYWGDQPFTAGPIYFGAIVCFLFFLGMLLTGSPVKWWALSLAILSIVLSWGKNFPALTNLMYDHFPLYNKFRSVTMILSITQLVFPLVGIMALQELVSSKNELKLKAMRPLMISAGSLLGLTMLLFLTGGGLFRFISPNDAALQMPDWLQNSLVSDRVAKFRSDAIRSFFFILAGAGLIWMFLKDKITEKNMTILLVLVIVIDLWTVNKRYLSAGDFKDETRMEKEAFAMSEEDKIILRDEGEYFRVMNLARNTFNEGITSYYHKSIGGYSAIKMGRYQELIENHISRNNMNVFNMLNTRYFIIPSQSGQRVQPNPGALGNCWFVKEARVVKNADEEIEALGDFDPASIALVDERFGKFLKPVNFDSAATISLTSYHPMKMEYKASSSGDQLAVFSDLYYQPGWISRIDGQVADHFRVNYVLRGMVIPAGEHTIEFEFRPGSYFAGEKIGAVSSIALVLLMIFNIYMITARKKN
ncbi:MAG TPA: hypothetical protein VI583_12520 [Cyclobacteriaceae bacterium]|nr:hypothetical protein [Cyclobacteriaceae bacterium]